MEPKVKTQKARITDVPEMHRLINFFASQGAMLPRPLSEIYENVRDFFVAKERRKVVGCVALHVSWVDLVEIKALAVAEDRQHQGIGALLVEACLKEARDLGIDTVFCLTYRPEFFEAFGFTRVNVMDLPRKVWGECQRCAKFPSCDEVALTIKLAKPKRRQA